jgi:hypothetical protein
VRTRSNRIPAAWQTAEGELSVEIPQVGEAAERFVSRLRAALQACAGDVEFRRVLDDHGEVPGDLLERSPRS